MMEKDLKIMRGQALNLAFQTMKDIDVMENLDELFSRAEKIYRKAKEIGFMDKI